MTCAGLTFGTVFAVSPSSCCQNTGSSSEPLLGSRDRCGHPFDREHELLDDLRISGAAKQINNRMWWASFRDKEVLECGDIPSWGGRIGKCLDAMPQFNSWGTRSEWITLLLTNARCVRYCKFALWPPNRREQCVTSAPSTEASVNWRYHVNSSAVTIQGPSTVKVERLSQAPLFGTTHGHIQSDTIAGHQIQWPPLPAPRSAH